MTFLCEALLDDRQQASLLLTIHYVYRVTIQPLFLKHQVAVQADEPQRAGGDQAEVHRHVVEVWQGPLPVVGGEGEVPGTPQVNTTIVLKAHYYGQGCSTTKCQPHNTY